MTRMDNPDERDDHDEALARRFTDEAIALGEWAGVPLPVPRAHLVMEPRYPYAGIETSRGLIRFRAPAPRPGVTGDEERVYNRWYSRRLGRMVSIRGDDTRRRAVVEPRPEEYRLDMAFTTMKVAGGWSPRAERRAREKLRTMISPGHERSYELTGGFLERSRRSGVVYLFRKLRPTLALRHVPSREGIRVLAALCLHPVGYYEGSWAGAMTPTDDVIAHLLLMRGCEARFWARAVQHPIWDPAAGL
jgi:hypothetical protein